MGHWFIKMCSWQGLRAYLDKQRQQIIVCRPESSDGAGESGERAKLQYNPTILRSMLKKLKKLEEKAAIVVGSRKTLLKLYGLF